MNNYETIKQLGFNEMVNLLSKVTVAIEGQDYVSDHYCENVCNFRKDGKCSIPDDDDVPCIDLIRDYLIASWLLSAADVEDNDE